MNERTFRDPRRRSLDAGFAPRVRARTAAVFAPSPGPRPGGGPPTRATVKWYSPEKGFGFVVLDDGSGDAFLHASVIEQSGRDTSALKPGAALQVRVGQGPKGPQITELIDVDESAAAAPPAPAQGQRPAPHQASRAGTRQITGTVKWYNSERGFGFVSVDSGRSEVFVHATVLQRSRLANLSEGQRVTMEVTEGRKGLEAVTIHSAA